MNDPSLNALPGTVALTASYPRCANAYGLYDMVGNLHEWTAAVRGTFRGGYYLDTHINGNGCDYKTTAHSVKTQSHAHRSRIRGRARDRYCDRMRTSRYAPAKL